MAVLGIFVPVTTCILVTVLLFSFLAFRTSTIFKQTMATVRTDDHLKELIGSPVQPGILVLGTFSRHASGTMVNLTIPLYGPKGKATAFAVGSKTGGGWKFTTLQIQVKGRKNHIDLLNS
jgi:hypothetical protein